MKLNDVIDKDDTDFQSFEKAAEDMIQEEATAAVPVRRFELPAWVKAPTGDGDVEDYVNHVLNFNHSKGLARIIRGLTGIVGNLNFAVVDIFLGVLQFGKERKAARSVVEVAAVAHYNKAN